MNTTNKNNILIILFTLLNIYLYAQKKDSIVYNKEYFSVYRFDEFSNSTSLSIFDDYDMTLLGDIHKSQFFTSNVAYCGSLIQQNHGEDSLPGDG